VPGADLPCQNSPEVLGTGERPILSVSRTLLCNIPRSAISTALGVSKTYAGEIRTGRSLPHPRHWLTLAKLVGRLAGLAEREK
jgi:hypothetical protein